MDVRKNSPTFGQWVGVYLSAENKKQFWILEGFTHGFYVTSDKAKFVYKCTDYYNPNAEHSILWNDNELNISWPLKEKNPLLSEKIKKDYFLIRLNLYIISEKMLSLFIKNRKVIYSLVKNEFKLRYLGNNFGIAWAFLQPLTTIIVLWFVFQVGFKAIPVDNVPFILWLSTGMIPWFFISDSLSSGTQSIIKNSFLVKKIIFNVELLPIISIFSNLILHVFFVGFLLFMYLLYGYKPSLSWLQIPYFIFSSVIFLIGISWVTSSVVLFFRDMTHLINIIVQFGFWLTPIFWNLNVIPEKYQFLIKINPLVHIVSGYRNMLVNNQFFWEDLHGLIYFWSFTLLMLLLGYKVFFKLRPHFADVI